ncbi:sigma-70 family RNA polymerase sigma factor [Caenimonas sp. SL110]|uniref:sigma-70 family RNA polymerase sigma factor n=1 Tax=Caenimonas sp. SL110 TaxID=1450524 RepID=UPI00065388D6|nr:sigma-70 family RNA polymerase sigma factor [Caenimonas sp. SL110]
MALDTLDPVARWSVDEVLDEAKLWELFRVHRSDAARQKLIALHMPAASTLARVCYSKRIHDEIEYDDYHQLAAVGLLESLDRYDPQFGVQFKTFAAQRMHGSIIDGIARLTEKQQQIAARQRAEAKRRAVIKEAADAPAKGVRNAEQALRYVAEVGIAFALSWILDGTGMIEADDSPAQGPGVQHFYRNVQLRELRQRIAQIVETLPPQERRVIRSHYFQEVAFEEIAATMQLTRGRISQIHRRGLELIKDRLRPRDICC